MTKNGTIIEPYGGELVNLLVPEVEKEDWLEKANHYPSLQLSDRSLHDLELLAVGGFSPLTSFMGEDDYSRVLTEMRLADGVLFPIPIDHFPRLHTHQHSHRQTQLHTPTQIFSHAIFRHSPGHKPVFFSCNPAAHGDPQSGTAFSHQRKKTPGRDRRSCCIWWFAGGSPVF